MLSKPVRQNLGGTAFLVIAALVLVPFMMDEEAVAVPDAQAHAPGQLADLGVGTTHFEVAGTGQPVVLVHGFNGPMTTWRRNIAPLVAQGYQVWSYDLIGRGYSDRPAVTYDLDLFVRQLEQLVEQQGIEGEFTLVGSSFGCVVATEFALRHPDRVAKLALIGPAGFPNAHGALAEWINVPVLSDHFYRAVGGPLMRRVTREYYVEPDKFPRAHDDFAAQQRIDGFRNAALSTMRHSPLLGYDEGWKRLGQSDIPVLLVWGREDVSFPYANHEQALEWIPQARLVTIENAAHLPQYERPEAVHRPLLAFLSQ